MHKPKSCNHNYYLVMIYLFLLNTAACEKPVEITTFPISDEYQFVIPSTSHIEVEQSLKSMTRNSAYRIVSENTENLIVSKRELFFIKVRKQTNTNKPISSCFTVDNVHNQNILFLSTYKDNSSECLGLISSARLSLENIASESRMKKKM